MNEFFVLIQKLSGVGFGTLLSLILYGSFKGYWVWGSAFTQQHEECDKALAQQREEYEKRLTKLEDASANWQIIALRASGLAVDGIAIAQKRTNGAT